MAISKITNDGIGDIDELTVDTDTLVVDSTNNWVGIGTSSPARELEVTGSGNVYIKVSAPTANDSAGIELANTGGTWLIQNDDTSSEALTFDRAGTERMRIDSSGSIYQASGHAYIGIEKSGGSYAGGERNFIIYAGAAEDNLQLSARNVADGSAVFAAKVDNVTRAEIEANGDFMSATNSYGSTSDQTLKENIVASGSQWDDIKAVQVKKFSYIRDGLDAPNMLGVIAQDLEASGMNGLVSTMEEGDGNTYKTVKYSVLYMKAIKALQEAIAKIETLETKVAALEAN